MYDVRFNETILNDYGFEHPTWAVRPENMMFIGTEIEIPDPAAIRAVKTIAEIGDYVLITSPELIPFLDGKPEYKKGDILQIIGREKGILLRAKYGEGVSDNGLLRFLLNEEYVVLKGYNEENVILKGNAPKIESDFKAKEEIQIKTEEINLSEVEAEPYCYKENKYEEFLAFNAAINITCDEEYQTLIKLFRLLRLKSVATLERKSYSDTCTYFGIKAENFCVEYYPGEGFSFDSKVHYPIRSMRIYSLEEMIVELKCEGLF